MAGAGAENGAVFLVLHEEDLDVVVAEAIPDQLDNLAQQLVQVELGGDGLTDRCDGGQLLGASLHGSKQIRIGDRAGGLVADDGQHLQVVFVEHVRHGVLDGHRADNAIACHEWHKQGRARRVLGRVAGAGRKAFHLVEKIAYQQWLLRRAQPADDAHVLRAWKRGGRKMHPILNPDLERQAVPFEDPQVKTLHPTGDNACDLLVDQLAQRIDVQLRTNDGQAGLGERRQL